jgi:hypothetical protein
MNKLRTKRLAKERRLINREYVTRMKMVPCKDCGIQYKPWIMQFDHRNPHKKEFELSDLYKSYSIKRIQAEIDKCDVVCANCHAERTHCNRYLFVQVGK